MKDLDVVVVLLFDTNVVDRFYMEFYFDQTI